MRSPTVSVIIATNRPSPYLDEALRSVSTQTRAPVDVVVVDDGSPDPERLDRLVARHDGARLLRQPGAGVSTARNYGVLNTAGDLLAFLDDDDRWHPRRLELAARALEASPEAVVSHCRMRTIDQDGVAIVPGDQHAVNRTQILQRDVGLPLPCLMIRRGTFWRIGGFHPSMRRAQDLDLVLKAANEGPFAFVNEVLVDYRAHDRNNTRQYRELAGWIDTIIGLHSDAALQGGDRLAVRAHRVSARRNDRFAAWSAARAAREKVRARRFIAAGSDVAWAFRFAPTAPLSWAGKRLSAWSSRS